MSEILCDCCGSEGDHPSRIICDACLQSAKGKAECCIASQTENERLKKAGKTLYYAGVWHCDRPVDEAKLWEALRDAMGLSKGTSPKVLKGQQ